MGCRCVLLACIALLVAAAVTKAGCESAKKRAPRALLATRATRWRSKDDGSTDAMRSVCLDASSTLVVRATDTAIAADELSYEAQTATADVTVNVLDCSDAGVPPTGTTCDEPGVFIANPSFEGTAQLNSTGAEFDAAPWLPCDVTPDVSDETSDHAGGEPATDGTSYLFLALAPIASSESISQRLCSPLPAGQTRHFTVDVMPHGAEIGPLTTGPGAAVQLFGASSACGEDELLGTSTAALPTGEWTTTCLTITPSVAHAFLKLRVDPFASSALVDNLVPVAACP